MTREEAEQYLENRRQKRFTVIQSVLLAELDGLRTPNAYGDLPLIDLDPKRPAVTPGSDPTDPDQYDYWDHVDFILDMAEKKGLVIGLLPTRGDKILPLWGVGPRVFAEANARVYGRFLGRRYRHRPNVIWILGGDRPGEWNGEDVRDIIRALAEGIREEDPNHLMTYHPWGGGASSAIWFHEDPWLDFNMIQSGHHARNFRNDLVIETDYRRFPVKPCLDGEARYEDHPIDWEPRKGWFDAFDVRQAAYWALFAGACGHTYGSHALWQMADSGRTPISYVRHTWRESLDLEGAFQMALLRTLFESYPLLDRFPDQSLILTQPEEEGAFLRAIRGRDYALVYTPLGYPVHLRMGVISGGRVRIGWFNPRTGYVTVLGIFANQGEGTWIPLSGPGRGNDWVLVMEDVAVYTDGKKKPRGLEGLSLVAFP